MNAAQQILSTGQDAAAALLSGGETISYAELRERVARTAGWLRSNGVGPADRVIVIGADSIDWVVAWLAAIWAGAVAVGVNPRLKSEELGEIFSETAARVCFADTEAAAAISTVSLHHPLKIVALQSALGRSGPAVDAVICQPSDPAFWIFSSGTTGRPKAVVHAHRAAGGCAAFASQVLRVSSEDRLFATSRLFFAYALANNLLAGLMHGATVVLDPQWPDPALSAAVVARQRPTVLFSVPTFYHQLLTQGSAAPIAGAGVRAFVSAGESLPPQVAARWRDATAVPLFSGYGMSETLALVLFRDSRSEAARAAPLTEVRADAADATDQPVRLWFRHPSLALGYHQWPDLQQRNFVDGWCSGGDLFLPSGDGGWLFAGRDDSLVKIAGRWVSTIDLQQELANELGPEVEDVAVAALAGTEGLTGIAVFAVARAGHEEAARALLRDRVTILSPHRRPRWEYWLEAMPRTATGKVQVARLRSIHAGALGL